MLQILAICSSIAFFPTYLIWSMWKKHMLLFSMLASDLEEKLNTISGDHGSALSFVIAVG